MIPRTSARSSAELFALTRLFADSWLAPDFLQSGPLSMQYMRSAYTSITLMTVSTRH